MSDLHWIDYVRAFGPLLIAVFVAWIAFQQWQTNKHSLREKLFDRRLHVYELVREFYFEMLRDGDCSDENLRRANEAMIASAFLFRPETREAIESFRKIGVNYQYLNKMQRQKPNDPSYDDWVEATFQMITSLPKEFETVFDAFESEMSFPKQ